MIDVPLVIRGEAADRKRFQEEQFTLIVNAHGALLMLESQVSLGQKLLLMNPKNWHECEAKVVHIGPAFAGSTPVGIELDRSLLLSFGWSVLLPQIGIDLRSHFHPAVCRFVAF
jgi:hypothetical protein